MRPVSPVKKDGMKSLKLGKSRPELTPVNFSWPHGGEEVYFVCSTDGWRRHRMASSAKNFSRILEVPPGVHRYKFIVDGVWQAAPDQNHLRENDGAYSNYVKVRSTSQSSICETPKEEEEKIEKDDGFSQFLPDWDYLPGDVPPTMPSILNKKLRAGDDPPPACHVDHLMKKEVQGKVVSFATTGRYRDKIYSTVMYKPKLIDEAFEQGFTSAIILDNILTKERDEKFEDKSRWTSVKGC